MRCHPLMLALAAVLPVLGAGVLAEAQTSAPNAEASRIKPDEANRRGDEAYAHQDYAAAMRWYRQAAAQGYAAADTNIGYLYAKGLGVPADDKEAVRWYRIGAEKGDPTAQYNLGLHYATGGGVPEDMAEARAWMRKAAAAGDQGAGDWLATHGDP